MRRATGLALCLLLAAAPLPAAAQKSAKQEDGIWSRVTTLSGEAIDAFKGYSFRRGGAKLQQALQIVREAGQLKDKRTARIYALLGLWAVAGANDLYRGLYFFTEALRLDQKVGMPRSLVTPQVLQVYRKAKQARKAIGKPPKIALDLEKQHAERVESGIDKSARGLVHELIDEAKRGYPVPVKASAGADIRGDHFYLFYRPAGRVKFSRKVMKKQRGTFRATIPASVTSGRYFHYYVEARDKRGRLAASVGSARSPNVVIVK